MIVKLISSTDKPEKHIEYCARTSYDSLDKMADGSHAGFLSNLLRNGHLSVFEHASATFLIDEISRAASHQLVRHRLATYTQKSQRYVKENDFGYVVPPSVEADPEALAKYRETVNAIRSAYNFLAEKGIKREDARFLLPNAAHTTLTMTANFREWFVVLDLRVSPHAQWEIRELGVRIWKELYAVAPVVFGLTYFENWSKDFDYKKRIFEERIA